MVIFGPRQSGMRSGQRRAYLPETQKAPVILLKCEAKSEIVQFVPEGQEVTLVKMPLSLTGCWSPHVSSGRYKLPVEVARKVYRKLQLAGYVEG